MSRKVYLTGMGFWANYLADKLRVHENFDAKAVKFINPSEAIELIADKGAALLVIGLGARLSIKRIYLWSIIALFALRDRKRNRVIFYWVGGDNLTLRQGSSMYVSFWRWIGVDHICGAPWFVEDLRAKGIPATAVLFPYDTEPAERQPCTPKGNDPFKVCSYLSPMGWEELCGDATLRIAEMTPRVQWDIMGMNAVDVPTNVSVSENVRFLGWVSNPLEVQNACNAFFRMVEYDGLSGAVRDAIAMRKIVFYSIPVSGAINIAGMSEVDIASRIDELGLSPNSHRELSGDQQPGISLPSFASQIRKLADYLRN